MRGRTAVFEVGSSVGSVYCLGFCLSNSLISLYVVETKENKGIKNQIKLKIFLASTPDTFGFGLFSVAVLVSLPPTIYKLNINCCHYVPLSSPQSSILPGGLPITDFILPSRESSELLSEK